VSTTAREVVVDSDSSERLLFLVVADDATSAMVLRRTLAKLGHDVLLVNSGKEGVRIFEAERVDMVLMDVQTPSMDDFEATRQIKAQRSDEFVPVVFLTGSTDEAALAQCVEAGGDDFLRKPYSRVVLHAKINALCRIRDFHKERMIQRDIVARHQERLIQEQEVAEKLFSNMVNRSRTGVGNVRCMVSPASIFNGDLVLTGVTPSGGVRVLVGDFTGHGLQAAIGALPAADIFYSMTEKGFSITDVIRELNEKLVSILPTSMFFACALMELDTEHDRLSIWSGGMPDVIVSGRDGKIRRRLQSKHVALGIVSNSCLKAVPENIPIEIGDRVYLFSDGIIEASSPDEEMYGQGRLEAFIGENAERDDFFEALSSQVLQFTQSCLQKDDFTLAEVCHIGPVAGRDVATTSRVLREPMHWSSELVLDADTLRGVDPLPLLMQSALDIQALHQHREKIYMVLAELYSNALDHGLLQLDSRLKETPQGFREYYTLRAKRLEDLSVGRICIRLSHERSEAGGRLSIHVEDSGPGFDFESKTRSLEANSSNSGRGMALIRSLCDQVVYSEAGTCVDAAYFWSNET
jgi:CheY-like chemotaxis protein